MKHIYWFCYFDTSEPSVRYRGTYLLSHLHEEYGIKYSICYPGYSIPRVLRFISLYFSVLFFRKKHSVIVFQKIRTNRVYATLLKLLLFLRPKDTVYDFDDADYLTFNKKTIDHFIKNCTICTTGSSALQDYAYQFNKNTIINTSPTITHSNKKKTKNSVLNIGWIGYYDAHKENIETLLIPAVTNLPFPIKLTLLGVTNPSDIEHLQATFKNHHNITIETPQQIDWNDEENIYKQISQFDVGVSPLLNNEKNRAKSAFKLKQYLCSGIPVLASPTGENRTHITHGENGFLCNDSDEFRKGIISIQHLRADEYMYMSEEALKTSRTFNMEQFGLKFIGLYLAEEQSLCYPLY